MLSHVHIVHTINDIEIYNIIYVYMTDEEMQDLEEGEPNDGRIFV